MKVFNLLTISCVGLDHYLVLAALLLVIGIIGMVKSGGNLITLLISVELMLLAININMVAFSAYLRELSGQLFSLFILAIAAAETAVGLALILVYYRNRSCLNIDDLSSLKG